MVEFLNKFIENIDTLLPEICRDTDLIKHLPNIFKNPANLHRMRARNQAPRHFFIQPHFFYLKPDVLDWFREKYQRKEQEEEKKCCLK